jgi:hypothetical protein
MAQQQGMMIGQRRSRQLLMQVQGRVLQQRGLQHKRVQKSR